jgi:plasmid stability protein
VGTASILTGELASLSVRNLDVGLNARLKRRAALHRALKRGRSEEDILRLLSILLVSVIMMMAGSALAVDCSVVQPTPPQNSDSTSSGGLDVTVDGFVKKLLTVRGNIEGTYRNVITNIQPQFPNADRIYVWERILFLECQLINEDHNMNPSEKQKALIKVLEGYNQPPPSINSGSQNNTLTNSGSGVNAIQGNGNSITNSGGKQ